MTKGPEMTNLTSLPRTKPRTKKAMIDFLRNHFRYNTMNSWNRSTSYAVKIKIDCLRMTSEERSRCYDLLGCDGAADDSGFNDALHMFDIAHDYEWQIGVNGRSGGYAVLYEGRREPSGYESRCTACGQLNYTSVEKTGKRCGKCGAEARVDFTTPHTRVVSFPGRGTDMDEDFSGPDWSAGMAKRHFDVVWAFDVAVENACRNFLAYAKETHAEEITVMVPHKVTVARED